MIELLVLEADHAGSVTEVRFRPEQRELVAVYADESRLRRWSLTNTVVMQSFNVFPVGLGGAAFNATGSMLATSAGVEWLDHAFDDAYLGWQVWSVDTGELIKSGGKYYTSRLTRSLMPDILLNVDGSWALMIDASETASQTDETDERIASDIFESVAGVELTPAVDRGPE
jgi:hypothetical protein